MESAIAKAFQTHCRPLLSYNYEQGGYIDNTTIIQLPSASEDSHDEDGRLIYVWNKAYTHIWHTHPGGRNCRYEAPSGADIVAAAMMSIDLQQPVNGYVLESNGVWHYTVTITEETIRSKPNIISDLMWLADNWAARLCGIEEYLLMYEEPEMRKPLDSVPSYLEKWTLNAEALHDTVHVMFFPQESF